MNTAFNRLTTLKRIIPATTAKMSKSSSVAAARSDGSGETRKRIPARDLKIDSTYMMKSGYEIPVLGFGVYQTPASDCTHLVSHALRTGYRHIDSASAYRNESACASGLTASTLPRSSYFFTSKVPPKAQSYTAAKAAIAETLAATEELGYVDLMLLHAPYGGREGRLGAWRALVEAVREGKVRSIGVSNFGVHHLEELEGWIQETEAREGKGRGGVLSVNQVELHPWLGRRDIVAWCKERGVLLEAYSPLVRGTRWGDESLKKVAERVGRTEAQVLLRWSLQMGFVPLPKSVGEGRIEENAGVFGWELSGEDMKMLATDEYSPCTWDPTVSRD